MLRTPSRPHPGKTLQRTGLLLIAALSVLPAAAVPQTCDRFGCGTLAPGCGGTPAAPVPSNLWGELQPTDVGTLPPNRDSTGFNEATQYYGDVNWFEGLAIENNYLVSGSSHGLAVWDLHQDPAHPTFLGKLTDASFPHWSNVGEIKWPLQHIAMPAGNDNVAVVTGLGHIGIAMVSLANKSMPKIVYQNYMRNGTEVYAATIGGTQYAFMASPLGSPSGGILVYDMSAAQQRAATTGQACVEAAPAVGQPVNCPGVYVGTVGTSTSSAYIHGVDNYIAFSGNTPGVEIWNVANPRAPQRVLAGLNDPPTCTYDLRSVYGVAMWQSAGHYYLGLRTSNYSCAQQRKIVEARIYDVSCIAAGGCSGMGNPIWSRELTDDGTSSYFVTFSRGGANSYLYYGSDNKCGGGAQREYLFDVTVPSLARDLTPPNGYWGWYYRGGPTGFVNVMPRRGKFNGAYFYRAALSIMDVHRRTGGVAPAADFDFSPAQIYPGDTVTFNDRSSGGPTSWNWTFSPDGNPVGGTSTTSQSPQVAFAAKGTKTVSLTATNSVGPSTPTAKQLTVLDPAPQVGGITVVPASPVQCQPVTLTATGVTGKATLGLSWKITDPTSLTAPGGTSAANPFTWDTKLNNPLPNQAYTATITVSNGVGTASKSATFTLGALQALPSGGFAPTNTPFTAGTVQLNVSVPGATEWNWDFGDGNGFTGWTSDPTTGPSPSHTYTTIGDKTVRVKVRNCLSDQNGVQSDPLVVHVLQISPLIAKFIASGCTFGPCSYSAGDSVPFSDQSQGSPDFFDYDWAHVGSSAATCSFTDSGHTTAVASHVFATSGNYRPCLRVRRGASESTVYVLSQTIVVGTVTQTNPPSIQISGSSSAQVGQALSLSAAASNCTPSPTGWSWSLAGGTAPSTNGSSVSVTYASVGGKSVTVTNSGCAGAIGSLLVNITPGGNTGGGSLAGNFTFSPANPTKGQAVAFDGSPSTGNPNVFSWSFGDGSSGTGKTVSHTYANAGNYSVVLTVCSASTCAGSAPQAVVVGNGGPTPLDPNFSSTALCLSGPGSCEVTTGAVVTLHAVTTQATSYAWDFGDGTTASGASVTHTWSTAASYPVKLTVANSQTSASQTIVFKVTGPSTASAQSVLLPWIAQTRGVLVQSSDLYVHNPGSSPLDVTLEFRRRGTPETNPPRVTRTVEPGATLFSSDVLNDLFGRPENTVGFVTVSAQSLAAPVITSYNTTFQSDGAQFGQTISGVSMTPAAAAAASPQAAQVQHLIALNDNTNEVSYFGLSNPNDQPASYRLSLFDNHGKAVGAPADLVVSRLGLKQFQREEIESLFGTSNLEDFRVQIETVAGGQIYPYGAKLRTASFDPSFIRPGETRSKLYVIGALSTPGLNSTLWRSDVVLSNTSDKVIQTTMSFISVGVASQPLAPVTLTLQPGETQRLANVVADRWGVTDAVGILTFSTDPASSAFPLVQGESYDFSTSVRRFGQSMPALPESAAASAGQGHYMVGLRQDTGHWTAFWLFNPSDAFGTYDLVYRALDGKVLGQITGLGLPPGKSKLFRPSEHPIPAAGVPGGFTVQILVHSGKILAAGQVVNLTTNDPAYILGTTR